MFSSDQAGAGASLQSRVGGGGCGCDVSRRGFLGGLGALGAGSMLPGCTTLGVGGAPAVVKNRIDTHHHFFPPSLVAAYKARNIAEPPMLNWSLAKTMDDMDRAGVATAILSVTTPGVNPFDAPTARRLAREANENAARLMSDHKGRFGSFAMLPMQDIDGSLKEIEYALDTLKADGIGLLTSYGDKWLGHPSFTPVLAELNRRKAILYTHPTVANCCRNLLPDTPPTVVEFGTDTTRTIVNIVFSGAANKFSDIKFIFSHAGGSLPFLTERLEKMPVINKNLAVHVPNGVLHELKRFYYDTAWAAHPYALSSLLQLVNTQQVLFASDYPYRTSEDNVKGLVAFGFGQKDLDTIWRGNAQRLIPRLRSA
jgi:predicted TIM-barrel fold metal-dependent hydrolase